MGSWPFPLSRFYQGYPLIHSNSTGLDSCVSLLKRNIGLRVSVGNNLVMLRPPNIQTERLLLVALMPEDIETLIARDFGRFLALSGFRFPPDNPNIGDLAWHLSAIQADGRQLPWRMRVIVERSSQTVVGSINLKGPPSATGDVEIGWGLIEGVRGRGYATEASAAVIQWARQQSGVSSISATIPDDNHPSQRLAKRLGLTRTSETRRNLPLWKCDANPAAKPAC